MKELSMTRKVDRLGRVVIPMEVRRKLSYNEGDRIAFSLDERQHALVLKKTAPSCICCRTEKNLSELPGCRYICHSCLQQVKPLP